MVNKKLVISILISIVLIPISSAVDIRSNKTYISIENPAIEPLDATKEIITKIDGSCTYVEIHSKKGLVRDVTFYVENWGSYLDIDGWRYPFWTYFHEMVTYLHASFFIGFIREVPGGADYSIRGIALGDIEWS